MSRVVLITVVVLAKAAQNTAMRYPFPFMAEIARDSGTPLANLSLALGLGDALGLLAFIQFSDVFGPRKMCLVGLVLLATSQLVSAFSPALPILLAGRGLLSLGLNTLNPSAGAYIASHMQGDERRVAMTVIEYAWPLSTLVGVVSAGEVLRATSWRSAYLALALLCLASLALAVFFLPPDFKAAPAAAAAEQPAELEAAPKDGAQPSSSSGPSPSSSSSPSPSTSTSPSPSPSPPAPLTVSEVVRETMRVSRKILGCPRKWVPVILSFCFASATSVVFATYGRWLETKDVGPAAISRWTFGIGIMELAGVATAQLLANKGQLRVLMISAMIMGGALVGIAAFQSSSVNVTMAFAYLVLYLGEICVPFTFALASFATAEGVGALMGLVGTGLVAGRMVASLSSETLLRSTWSFAAVGLFGAVLAAIATGTATQYRQEQVEDGTVREEGLGH
jgi:predicted MFS family arabinose efflux permease